MSWSLASLLKSTNSKAKNSTGLSVLRKNKQRRGRGKKGIVNFLNKLKARSEGLNRLKKLMKYSADDSFTSYTISTPYITWINVETEIENCKSFSYILEL